LKNVPGFENFDPSTMDANAISAVIGLMSSGDLKS